MGNVYKITATDIGDMLYSDLYKYTVSKRDNDVEIAEKELLFYKDMLQIMKEEIKEGSVVAIRNFGSFSISKRKSGSFYVKLSQAKQLRGHIHDKLKKKSLTNLMLDRKQKNNFIEIEEIVKLLISDGNILFLEDVEHTKEKYKSSEVKIKRVLVDKVLHFFLKVEQLVFEYKLVNVHDFGCFFLKNNQLYGLHFKYSSASCQYLFKKKPKINRLIEKLNAMKVKKEMPWE